MAVYFDQRLETDFNAIKEHIHWHKTFPILAAASYIEDQGGSVQLFLEEGERAQGPAIQKSFQVTCLSWHPQKKILAVGWESGEILTWNGQEMELHESAHLHKSPVTILGWSSNGTRLTSGDKAGILVVWKADTRGLLQQLPLCQHSVQEPLTKIVYRPPPSSDAASDISQLARAAVSGDESALDMFSWKKGKSSMKLGPSEALSFFVGGASGGVYFVNEDGKCVQCFSVDTSVKTLLYYGEKDVLVTVTENLMLTQHSVLPEGDVKEIMKVKLSGKADQAQIVWAGKGILATATGEGLIRMWDLEKEENYILSLEGHSGYDSNEGILCTAFCENKGVLAGGTNMGNVAIWKYSPPINTGGRKVEGEDRWKLQSPSTVEGPVRQLEWGSSKSLLAANTLNNVFMLSEQLMNSSFRGQTSVVQMGPSNLIIDIFDTGNHHDLKTEMQVKGVYTTKEALAVWNGKKVNVYEYSTDKVLIKAVGAFATESTSLSMYEQNVYTVEPGKVQVRTFQGTVKQLLTFSEIEGDPISTDICGNFLVIATANGVLKIYDLSRREAKAHSNPKSVGELIPGFGSIISAKCNCTGTRVSIQVRKTDGEPDTKLYFWDLEMDSVQYFNFESGRGEQDDYLNPGSGDGDEIPGDLNDEERGKNQAAKDIAGRYPVSHSWDPQEPKLIVCEAMILPQAVEKSGEKEERKKVPSLTRAVEEGPVEVMVVSLFSSENGLLIQDSYSMDPVYISLLGVEVPYHYFLRKSEDTSEPPPPEKNENMYNSITAAPVFFPKMVSRKVMRDFVGLESSDKLTRDAMMNFSYYLAIGNMDEAFKAIKLIRSESVWENMAKMCVKSRRLDVASVCLGNMGHARGAKALREAMKEPELDARVAMLAVQLGLHEDAERLLKNCKRYDLLNQFYQNCGQWGKAMETAEMYDRIHLRTTYYNYAKHLEAKGEVNGAIPNYEKSDTHRFEVPRMLFDEPDSLEAYIMKSRDASLRKWWAQYLESTGEMEAALQFYEAGQDYLSLVRVYCYCGNIEKAADICNETGDQAACYHLARQLENHEQFKEAIHFFTRAQAYGNAIRLCKEHGFEDQIMNLALLGRPEHMMEAARFFEQRAGMQDKAVMLFHKAGNFAKALDLAFNSKQFGALQLISADLDERADPALLQRCADFFLDNGQYDKAVDLLGLCKKYWDALKICMEQHVVMTEELAEQMTPVKGEGENDALERNKILEAIAEVSMHQGQYHIATKKFTQAGNKLKAMKALLKSGDTEKIVFFAGVSRQKEIYVMAANYLQSLDWRKDPEIMKNIIGFYTKGRALDSLAAFYDACAQVEIDEYQNYDKALGALGEAYKCLSKAKMPNESIQEEKLAALKHKMTLIKKFVMARRGYDEGPEEAVKQCQVLLEEPHLDTAVRIGDVYGFIIEHYARKEKWKPAYSCMEELRNKLPSVNLTYFVNMRTIEAIHRALDMPLGQGIIANNNKMNGYRGSQEEEDGEEVEEDVIDEMYNGP